MGLKEYIIGYAAGKDQFSRKELSAYLYSCHKNYSDEYLSFIIQNLIASGDIIRKGRGIYCLADQNRPPFHCRPDDEIKEWKESLTSSFPFVSFCFWNVRDIVPLMHDVPNLRMTVINCDKPAIRNVAEALSSLTDKLVLREPGWDMVAEFAYGRDLVIVTPLVSRAPIDLYENIPSPTLEKILVDILCEGQYHYLEGAEAVSIYGTALSDYRMNRKTLLAYASRRNRRKEVEQLLKQNSYDI